MSNWTKSAMLTAAAALLMAVPARAEKPADKTATDERLQAMANGASTPAEHAAVARYYRLRAEAFEQRASEHEASVRKMSAATAPMIHKHPGMAPRKLQEEKDRAVQARRAAQEAYRLADKHVTLAVEAQAGSPAVAGQ